jgi:hypothetical protein
VLVNRFESFTNDLPQLRVNAGHDQKDSLSFRNYMMLAAAWIEKNKSFAKWVNLKPVSTSH